MTVYAALRDRLLVVREDTPQARERLEGYDLECVAAHLDRPDRVFCGTFGAGLHRSIDGGDSWERVGAETIDPDEAPETAERRGAGGVSVMSVAVDPADPDTVWVGTEPSALFRSADGGVSWEQVGGVADHPSAGEWAFPPRPYTHHVRWIEVDPYDPDRVYVGVEAGALLVTPDAGETWVERPPGSRRDNHTLATHPDAEGRVHAAAGDGYAESTDSGESWDHPVEGLDHHYVWSVAVDPGDPEAVVVSAASGARAAHGGAGTPESYLYRRTNAAEEHDDERTEAAWERLEDEVPTGEGVVRAVLAAGTTAGELYAINNHGLYRSADGGHSWNRLGIEWPSAYLERTPRGLDAV
ncbi:MAG: WD40/YVTN/BNR-like repeat-containing protein [Halobacteriales archaeon]